MNPYPDEQKLRLIRALALVFSLLILAVNVAVCWTSATPPPAMDIGGLSLRPLAALGKNEAVVEGVRPGSPAAAAGIVAGDRVEFVRHMDLLSKTLGHKVDLTVISGEVARKASVAWSAKSGADSAWHRDTFWKVDIFSSVLSVLLGITVLLRSQPRRSNIAIGLLMVCFGYSGYSLSLPGDAPGALLLAMLAFDRLRLVASDMLLLYFARWLFEEEIAGLSHRVRAAFNALIGMLALYGIASVTALFSGYAMSIFRSSSPLDSTVKALACLLAFALLWNGWSRSAQQSRLKYAVLVGSTTVLILSFVLSSFVWANWMFYPVGEILNLVFMCSFSYAVLRHKVIDLGFAVNRAVVYGVISAVILVTFGLAEWMAEHVVHFEDRKESALLDGGIALVTYLVFHRIKHGVEHWIEKIFFRSWHDNEAKLRKFVREAVFISSVDALWQQLEQELGRFAKSPCKVFVRTAGDGFGAIARHAATPGVLHIDENSKLSLALQADRRPVVVQEEALVRKGTLAAPIFLRGVLQAIVLIEARGNGVPFRPDEIAAVGTAVNEVGHDYLTLRLNLMQQRDVEREQLLLLRSAECSILRDRLAQ